MKKRLIKTLTFLLAAFILSFSTPALAVELDFNNSSGQPDGANGMVFSHVGTENGTDFDLVVKALTAFKTASRDRNGTINPGASADGNINIHRSSATRFSFSFVETESKNPFTVSQFRLGFFDIDGNSNAQNGREKVVLFSPADYTLSNNTRLLVTEMPDDDGNGLPDGVRFTPDPSSPNNVPNPTNSGNMTSTQEMSAVYFDFEDTSEFILTLGVISGNPSGERNISFDDDLVLDDDLPLTVVPFSPEPEPEVCDPNESIPGAFSAIRIGDLDGFGFGDGAGLTAANGESVNVDGKGVLSTGDYLPDFNGDGKFSNRDGGDPFDNRSDAEAAGTFLTGDGYEDTGSTGSDYTDVFLGKAFTKLKSDHPFPDGDPKTLPNQPGFQFRFKVAKEKLPEGTQLFLNTMLGDYDVKPVQVILTTVKGKEITKELKLSKKGASDGSIQASYVSLKFDQVFIDGDTNGKAGYWLGSFDVYFDAPDEPATSFDFSEIGTNKIPLTPCP